MAKLRVEEAADRLWDYIVDQGLEVGTKLPNEYELAAVLGVGRSTVREAVRALAGRNLLEVRQGSGTYVSSKKGIAKDPLGFSLVKDRSKLTADLFEVRYLIEPRIAEKAAQLASPEDLEELEQMVIAIEESVQADASWQEELDIQFHTRLAQISGNLAMINLLPVINESIHLINEGYSTNQMKQASLLAHRKILNAIQAKDPIGAYESMQGHILDVRASLADQ